MKPKRDWAEKKAIRYVNGLDITQPMRDAIVGVVVRHLRIERARSRRLIRKHLAGMPFTRDLLLSKLR